MGVDSVSQPDIWEYPQGKDVWVSPLHAIKSLEVNQKAFQRLSNY